MTKIYTARGMNSKKIYAMGNDKESLFRRLQKMYPEAKIKRSGTRTNLNVYPEPLEIICRRGD